MSKLNKKVLKIVATIVIFVGLVIGVFFLLKHLGVTDKESLQAIISKTGAWGPIVFLLLQIVVTTLLSVIPGTSFTFLILAGLMFENVWVAISLSLVGVWASSILMFFIGDSLGEKVAVKLVGKESLSKAQDLIDTKTKVYLPLMFLFPFFPDDGVCLAAGLTKLKYRYFIPIVLIFRSIGVLATVLTSYYSTSLWVLLGLDQLQPIGWILLVNVVLFDAYVMYKLTRILEKKINERKMLEKAEELNNDEDDIDVAPNREELPLEEPKNLKSPKDDKKKK